MRRHRPSSPWPFSVPQDVFAYRYRADGWTLLELAYARQLLSRDSGIAELARRYGVTRPTVYRWQKRVKKEYPQLLRELEALIGKAEALLRNALLEGHVSADEYRVMKRTSAKSPVEAARQLAQGEHRFVAWLRQGGVAE